VKDLGELIIRRLITTTEERVNVEIERDLAYSALRDIIVLAGEAYAATGGGPAPLISKLRSISERASDILNERISEAIEIPEAE
jgi:hypothetical protein